MLSAELLDQSVVTSAAADSALSADAVGDKLKNGLGVVVKSADDFGIYGVLNACAVEVSFNLGKVVFALLAEVVGNLRRVLCKLLILRTFAVEQAHGVLFKTRKTGVTQPVLKLTEILP